MCKELKISHISVSLLNVVTTGKLTRPVVPPTSMNEMIHDLRGKVGLVVLVCKSPRPWRNA